MTPYTNFRLSSPLGFCRDSLCEVSVVANSYPKRAFLFLYAAGFRVPGIGPSPGSSNSPGVIVGNSLTGRGAVDSDLLGLCHAEATTPRSASEIGVRVMFS